MTTIAPTAEQVRLAGATSGFTLIEILVTLVVVCLGLLGLGAFQARLQQVDLEAYDRAQALVMLDAMVARISANRATAPCYAVTTAAGTPYFGYADTNHVGTVTCTGFGTSDTQQMAVDDMNAWDQMLKGATEAISGVFSGGALGARGCVLFDAATSTYTVVVVWQGLTPTVAPAVACANDSYSAANLRRAVWITFQPATLL